MPNQARTQHEAVRDDLGVLGTVLHGFEKIVGPAHKMSFWGKGVSGCANPDGKGKVKRFAHGDGNHKDLRPLAAPFVVPMEGSDFQQPIVRQV